jgi:hypothetical protein
MRGALNSLLKNEINGLVCACFQNERPLQGLAGYVDWYLGNPITHFVREGKITGQAGEIVYIPAIMPDRKVYHLIVVGAGVSNEPGERKLLDSKILKQLKHQISQLKIKNIGCSSLDLGFKDKEACETFFKEEAVCVLN